MHACVDALAALCGKALTSHRPRPEDRAQLARDLQDELVHALAVRWHGRVTHQLLRRDLHTRVLRAAKRRFTARARERGMVTASASTGALDALQTPASPQPEQRAGAAGEAPAAAAADQTATALLATTQSGRPAQQTPLTTAVLIELLELSQDGPRPSDAAAWMACNSARSHLVDAALQVARTVLEVLVVKGAALPA